MIVNLRHDDHHLHHDHHGRVCRVCHDHLRRDHLRRDHHDHDHDAHDQHLYMNEQNWIIRCRSIIQFFYDHNSYK